MFGTPYEQIAEGIRRGTKRADVRENFLSVLPLVHDHFEGLKPDYVQAVSRSFYPVGRDLLVPFDPPLVYGVGGDRHFPWFSFWRSNPLSGLRLSLFVTMVDELLNEHPDLEQTIFNILDFSAPKPKQPRELKVLDTKLVTKLSASEKMEMLNIFAEGFRLAQSELAAEIKPRDEKRPEQQPASDQLDLFDPS